MERKRDITFPGYRGNPTNKGKDIPPFILSPYKEIDVRKYKPVS